MNLSSIILLPLLLAPTITLFNLLSLTLTDTDLTLYPTMLYESLDCLLQPDHGLTLLEGLRACEETQWEDLLALAHDLLPALLLAQQDQLRRRRQQVRVQRLQPLVQHVLERFKVGWLLGGL